MTAAPDTAPTVPRQTCVLLVCRDGPDAARLRPQHLAAHLEFAAANWTRYLAAGPLFPREGEPPDGSFFLIRADSVAEALGFCADDPYFRCGLYADVTAHPALPAIGTAIGGKVW